MTDGIVEQSPSRHARWWLLATGIAVAAWGIVVFVMAFDIPQPRAYRPLGPRVFPTIIGAGLFGVGVAFVVQTLRGRDRYVVEHVRRSTEQVSPLQVLAMLAALVGYAALFQRLGYVVATMLFFPTSSAVLGSHRHLRDVVTGALLATITALVFDRLLGVRLPAGVLDGVL